MSTVRINECVEEEEEEGKEKEEEMEEEENKWINDRRRNAEQKMRIRG